MQRIILDKATESEQPAGVRRDGKFCDGMYFPRTKLTDTEAQVIAYFEKVHLKARKVKYSMEKAKDYWFVKLCEDSSPSIAAIKASLLKLMKTLRKHLHETGEESEIFMK